MHATVSKPILEQFAVVERAILYARVSYDDRDTDGRNLQGQLEMSRERAKEKGYRIVAELPEDEKGVSGAEIDLPKLNLIREMARSNEFDVLIVRELDRLSRNLAKQLIVEEELSRAGVRVEYVLAEYDDTPEGRLSKHIRATVAEYEREKIKERMTRGRRNKVKSGEVLLHGDQPPYGYRVSNDGKTLVIYEPEARIVRLIFTWYALGDETGKKLGTKAIARRLTEMGIPTWHDTHQRGYKKKGYAEWSDGTISGILKSETYIGTWHYGRKRGASKMNPRNQWLTLAVPPIISRELWEKAQVQKEYNKAMARRNVRKDYLVGRRVMCGKCGHKMYARSSWAKDRKGNNSVHKYYLCAARSGQIIGASCDMPSFRVDNVDAVVWKHISDILTDWNKLTEAIQIYQAEREQIDAPLYERLEVINDLLAENQAQLRRLLDLYLTGDFPKELLTERKLRLEQTIRALEKERGNLTSQLSQIALTADQIESLKENFAQRVTRSLDLAKADFETRRQIIDILDVRVTLAIENGQRVVYIQHALELEGKTLPLAIDGIETADHNLQTNDLSVAQDSIKITWPALVSTRSCAGLKLNSSPATRAIPSGP
jgi:site-specific DNA recombinase